jgi:hypothetical protein
MVQQTNFELTILNLTHGKGQLMGKKIPLFTLVSVALGLCCSAAPAGSPMGPPRALVGHHRWVVDFEYAHQKMDLGTCGQCRGYYRVLPEEPLELIDPYYAEFKIKDLKSDMFFGSVGYGVRENVDVFVRLGAVDAKDDVGPVAVPGCPGCEQDFAFDGSHGFAWGFGTKATFCQKGNLAWGGLLQITWANPDQSDMSGTVPEPAGGTVSGEMKLDWREIQIAIGPTWQVRDGLCIYGGPFWLFIRGDLDIESSWFPGATEAGRLICSHDVTEESEFGGYCGALWDVVRNTSLYAEYQFTGDAWGVGLGCILRLE